jgi:hypothetical protein
MEASKDLALICLAFVLFLTPSYAQDEVNDLGPETFAIDLCRYVSIFARDIMIARQKHKPMSEVLPDALNRLSEFPNGVEGATGEFLQSIEYVAGKEPGGFLSEFERNLKPLITELVKRAYDLPTYGTSGNQRDAINEFENGSFESCYQGFEETFGTSRD